MPAALPDGLRPVQLHPPSDLDDIAETLAFAEGLSARAGLDTLRFILSIAKLALDEHRGQIDADVEPECDSPSSPGNGH